MSKIFAKLYTKCLSERRIPTAWKNAKVMIIFKYYRPIFLLSNVYKVVLLKKVLTKRLEKILNENQPHEQAGFRSEYSTTADYQLTENRREHDIRSVLYVFVDYEKLFDSVQTRAVLVSLQDHGIEEL